MYALFNVKKTYAITVVLQLAVMCGIIFGYSAYLFPQWKANGPPFYITADTESLIATTSVCLRPLGALLDTVVIDRLGRRGTLRVIFIFLTVCWIVTGLAFNLEMFLFGRALNSLLVGMVTSTPLYISEISSPDNRANALALISPLITLGIAFTYVLMSAFYWRTTAFIVAVYSAIVLISTYTIPESAYWYIMKGRRAEAGRALKYLSNNYDDNNNNNNDHTIEEQLIAIERSGHDGSFASKWKTLRQPAIIGRFFVITLFVNFLQWTGYLVVPNYALTFFRSMRTGYDDRVLTIIFGFLCFFCDIVLIITVNKFKRKSFIIWCGIGMIASMIVTISLQLLSTIDRRSYSLSSSPLSILLSPSSDHLYRKVSLFAVYVYFAFSHVGFNELIWIIIPELFPTVIRGTAISIFCFIFFASMVFTFYFFPIILSCFGFSIVCTIFAGCALAIILITIFFIPETRNISLYEAGLTDTKTNTDDKK